MTHSRVFHRTGKSHDVTVERLDLDDIGAVVPKQLTCVGTHDHRRKIEHANARQRSAHDRSPIWLFAGRDSGGDLLEHLASNDQLLDLARAFINSAKTRVAEQPLDRIFLDIAVATVNLHDAIGYSAKGFG